jgi:hypothetical protein
LQEVPVTAVFAMCGGALLWSNFTEHLIKKKEAIIIIPTLLGLLTFMGA